MSGDLVFARRGDLSKCATININQAGWLCGTGCLLLQPPYGVLSSLWMEEVYRSFTTQTQINIHAVGSTMVNLNTGILSRLEIALPSYAEQQRIESRLNGVKEYYFNLIRLLNKLKVTKTGLMHDLLTGKVRVTNTNNTTLTPESL